MDLFYPYFPLLRFSSFIDATTGFVFLFRLLCVHHFGHYPLLSSADVAGARLAHPDMYGQPRKLRKLEVTRKPVLSDVVQFSPALGKKNVYRLRWVWLRLSLACAAAERLLETHIVCYNALNF